MFVCYGCQGYYNDTDSDDDMQTDKKLNDNHITNAIRQHIVPLACWICGFAAYYICNDCKRPACGMCCAEGDLGDGMWGFVCDACIRRRMDYGHDTSDDDTSERGEPTTNNDYTINATRQDIVPLECHICGLPAIYICNDCKWPVCYRCCAEGDLGQGMWGILCDECIHDRMYPESDTDDDDSTSEREHPTDTIFNAKENLHPLECWICACPTKFICGICKRPACHRCIYEVREDGILYYKCDGCVRRELNYDTDDDDEGPMPTTTDVFDVTTTLLTDEPVNVTIPMANDFDATMPTMHAVTRSSVPL